MVEKKIVQETTEIDVKQELINKLQNAVNLLTRNPRNRKRVLEILNECQEIIRSNPLL